MRLKGAGRAFMATGVVFTIVYILVSLSRASATGLRFGTLFLYVGIVLFIIGLSLRLARPRS